MSAVTLPLSGSGRDENKFLVYAVAASFVFHALLLFGLHLNREGTKKTTFPGPIVARILSPQAAPPEPQQATPLPQTQPQPQPTPPQPTTSQPKAAPQPTPIPSPSPAAKSLPVPVERSAEPAAPTQVPPSVPATPPSSPAPAPQQATPAPTKAEPATAPPADANLAEAIGDFRIRLSGEAKRFKRYPRVAIDNKIEGRVDIRISYNAEGRRASISVARSSGNELLDKSAVEMYQKTFYPVPKNLVGREFSIELPVIFSLADEQKS